MKNRRDSLHMKRAFALAERVSARAAAPNPRVGCVLVKGGRVVGWGAHERAGGPHAEAEALQRAGARARGAAAFVTLEPCADFPGKRTPSCARALAAAGVRRVVFAALDADPRVRGRGARLLRRAGVKTESAPGFAERALSLNRGYVWRHRRGRPWVVMKTALSLDGRAAAASGRSRWITGPEARRAVRRLRAELDAVAVGAGTALADDPALTAHGAGPDPLRVVFAGRRELPPALRLFRDGPPAIVYRIKRPSDLRGALRDLAARGVGTLLLEGGPRIHAAFLRAGLVDEARVFLSPKLLSGADDPNRAPRLRAPRLSRVGSDWLIQGEL